jgi:hypothetical protein
LVGARIMTNVLLILRGIALIGGRAGAVLGQILTVRSNIGALLIAVISANVRTLLGRILAVGAGVRGVTLNVLLSRIRAGAGLADCRCGGLWCIGARLTHGRVR